MSDSITDPQVLLRELRQLAETWRTGGESYRRVAGELSSVLDRVDLDRPDSTTASSVKREYVAAGRLRMAAQWCREQEWSTMAAEVDDLASDVEDRADNGVPRDYEPIIAALLGDRDRPDTPRPDETANEWVERTTGDLYVHVGSHRRGLRRPGGPVMSMSDRDELAALLDLWGRERGAAVALRQAVRKAWPELGQRLDDLLDARDTAAPAHVEAWEQYRAVWADGTPVEPPHQWTSLQAAVAVVEHIRERGWETAHVQRRHVETTRRESGWVEVSAEEQSRG